MLPNRVSDLLAGRDRRSGSSKSCVFLDQHRLEASVEACRPLTKRTPVCTVWNDHRELSESIRLARPPHKGAGCHALVSKRGQKSQKGLREVNQWLTLSPQAPRLPTRVTPWPQHQGTVPVVAPQTAPAAPRPAAQRPAPAAPAPAQEGAAAGLRRSARSNAGVAPPRNWYGATAQLKGKVKGVPVVSYREHGVCLTARPCARTPAPSRKPSAGPSNQAPPMPDVEEEEEAAPGAPREPPAADDDDDDFYA
jgi:hypothetical protein